MTRAIRVKMEATFLLRTYMPDWRDDHDIDTATRVLDALFGEFDAEFEGAEVGPCTCGSGTTEEFLTGEFETNPSCPWHGSDR